jgi:DNA (cytosine-5)-methyltransferase 1
VIDGVHYVPQSPPRVFFVAFRGDQPIPTSLTAEGPQASWHPPRAPQSKLRGRGRISQ